MKVNLKKDVKGGCQGMSFLIGEKPPENGEPQETRRKKKTLEG